MKGKYIINKNIKEKYKYSNMRHHKYLSDIHHLNIIDKVYDEMKNILEMRMNFITNQTIKRNKK